MDEKKEFNPDEHIGRYVNQLSKDIRYAASFSINTGGEKVTGEQCRLMSYICRRMSMGECVYQRDIESEFAVKRSSVASILGNLEKSGYIIRESDERDKRIKKIIPTEKGVMLSNQMRDNIMRLEGEIVRGMTEEEKQTLIRLIMLAINNVESSELLVENKNQSSKYKE